MALVGISLGSNLGDRLPNIRKALACLHETEVICSSTHLLASSVYETDPVDCPPDSEAFYNAVVEIETDLAPLELLRRTQEIERTFGRPTERERNAPRTIDLDLLYYDDLKFDEGVLILPHPRMKERAFVLVPLSDIRPDLVPAGFNTDAESHGMKMRMVPQEYVLPIRGLPLHGCRERTGFLRRSTPAVRSARLR